MEHDKANRKNDPDFPENWAWVTSLSKESFRDDALIVAGDSTY